MYQYRKNKLINTIIYLYEEALEWLEGVFVFGMAVIIWTLLYGLYYTSGIKLVAHPDDYTWNEQMTWRWPDGN